MKMTRIFTASALTVAGLFCSTGLAQEAIDAQDVQTAEATAEVEAAADVEATADVKATSEAVTLDADGNLVGKVFVNADGVETPLPAKVTLVKQDGAVVETVTADEEGVFAFQGVDPGAYEMFGASDGYVGQASYDVGSYDSSGCSSCNLGLQSSDVVSYDQYASAPASACGSCGGGGGGFGGGGFLANRGLLKLGLIGGIIAVAVSDDDDDASPDE